MMHTVHLADSIAQKGGQVFGWLNGRVFVDSAIFCSSNYFGVYVELVLVFVLLYILFRRFDDGMFSIVLLFSHIFFLLCVWVVICFHSRLSSFLLAKDWKEIHFLASSG